MPSKLERFREARKNQYAHRSLIPLDLAMAVGALLGCDLPGAASAVVLLWEWMIEHSDGEPLPSAIAALINPEGET